MRRPCVRTARWRRRRRREQTCRRCPPYEFADLKILELVGRGADFSRRQAARKQHFSRCRMKFQPLAGGHRPRSRFFFFFFSNEGLQTSTRLIFPAGSARIVEHRDELGAHEV
eukprot:6796509-Prymnesium_polylepis.1